MNITEVRKVIYQSLPTNGEPNMFFKDKFSLIEFRLKNLERQLNSLAQSMLDMTDVIDMAREYETRLADVESKQEVIQWNSIPKTIGFPYPPAPNLCNVEVK